MLIDASLAQSMTNYNFLESLKVALKFLEHSVRANSKVTKILIFISLAPRMQSSISWRVIKSTSQEEFINQSHILDQ